MSRSEPAEPASLLTSILDGAAVATARVAKIVGAAGLSVDQWRVLDLVYRQPRQAMTEVATGLLIPAATATRIVDHLVSEGLIYRSVDQADRRRVVLHASERGRGLLATVTPQLAALEAEFDERLGGVVGLRGEELSPDHRVR